MKKLTSPYSFHILSGMSLDTGNTLSNRES